MIFQRTIRNAAGAMALLAMVVVSGCAGDTGGSVDAAPTGTGSAATGGTSTLPHYDHVVVVMEENHSAGEVLGASDAPYINALAQGGAVFANAHGVAHPSEPNYLALFAGSTFGLTSDNCPQSFKGDNLSSALQVNGKTFIGYSESMPSAGFTGCSASGGDYARKHNPWVNFTNVPAASNQPLGSFPSDYAQLPTVAFVVPNQQNDMHSGSIQTADSWLQTQIDGYTQWAATHNSLLIVTWDEDDGSAANQILTIFSGAHVVPGQVTASITHYDVLRTIENIYGLPYSANAGSAQTISGIWQ